eukprot:NODE_1236_length_942_cov_89.119018_g1190_i0.p1 GENE.NODE_1236_length_942_cov_89.119018_g1190_i0~~NODE_1236_length_942_cov_89.119018_g1190_i0.p1  ORF type:complete len:274 (+),score=14.33 NODE_1236_length_942_cov_89.119018_g1190_i0:65-886(+)
MSQGLVLVLPAPSSTPTRCPSLDKITTSGCVGSVTYLAEQGDIWPPICQLLGAPTSNPPALPPHAQRPDEVATSKPTETKWCLAERLGGLRVAYAATTSSAVSEVQSKVPVASAELVEASRIEQFIQGTLTATPRTADLLVVQYSAEDTRSCYSAADSIVSIILAKLPQVWISVVIGPTADITNIPEARVAEVSDTIASIRPVQSSQCAHGKVIDVPTTAYSRVIWYKADCVRRDNCTTWWGGVERGCMACIQAQHFLKELAFVMGYLHKYGA